MLNCAANGDGRTHIQPIGHGLNLPLYVPWSHLDSSMIGALEPRTHEYPAGTHEYLDPGANEGPGGVRVEPPVSPDLPVIGWRRAGPRPLRDESVVGPPGPSPGRELFRDLGRRSGSVVILLPALNEEAGVGNVIDRIPLEALRRRGYDVRVWVIDGKSVDGTLEVARHKGANVFVQTGDGKGTGVRQALECLLRPQPRRPETGSRVFVMLDADGSYPPEDIPGFVGAIESGFDVVVGSRFRGSREEGAISPFNLLGNRLLSRLATFLFGTPVSDVCTGMWAFREDSLRAFGLGAKGFDLEADLFASSCQSGARIGEIPVDYSRRIGEAKLIPFRTGLRIAWRLLLRRLNLPEAVPLERPSFQVHAVEDAA